MDLALTCCSNSFDLKVGNRVYVDGKLKGQLGHVADISDCKKVIAVVDTNVHGQFYMAGSHFVTFDPTTLPAAKVSMWFKAPAKEDDEFVSSTDNFSFRLDDLKDMNINSTIAERGHDYYLENRVLCICLI